MTRVISCLSMVVLLFAATLLASTSARAAFLPPSAWQSTGHSSAKAIALGGALASAVESLKTTDGTLEKEELGALRAFYETNGYATLWIANSRLTGNGRALVAVLERADTHALPSGDYKFAVDAVKALSSAAPIADQVATEFALSAAAVLYARHATAGVIEPRLLGENTTIDPEAIDPSDFLKRISAGEPASSVLESLHPSATDYEQLRRAYVALREQARTTKWVVVPEGPSLKPGMTNSRVPIVRQRLVQSGDLSVDATGDTSELYDEVLAEAVKRFQTRHGLSSEGVVGPKTLAAMNMSITDRVKQLAINLERRRWLAEDLGDRHVFVNQANYRMQLVENGTPIFDTKVIIGKEKHQTPVFSDSMEYIEINPYWNVPKSIATEEYLPHLKANPLALSGMGIEMFSRQGSQSVQIDPREVDWQTLDSENFNILLRQPPSEANALGRVKFMFPNKHHVYLHDTPHRGLFGRQHRAFSHGCVRVKDPLKFAEVLMQSEGWSRAGIDKVVASGENTRINLKRRVPVHLAYWTAWIGADGKVHHRPDIYGRDPDLAKTMGLDAAALKLAELTSH